MDKLYWLEEIRLQDRVKVGDKAFYLSRILQRGYPVVPGFVISVDIWYKFLETLNSSDSLVADLPYSSLHLDMSNWQQLQQVARRLRQEVIAADIPNDWVNKIYQAATTWNCQFLILRPSLNISSPTQVTSNISGLLEPIFCICNPQEIVEGLKQTWSQLFRARSLLYWQNAGINLHQINFAILVQPIENAIASGLFTANNYGTEIEATYGLGVAITKGEVLPDIFYIEEKTEVIKEKKLGNKTIAYSLVNNTSLLNDESPAIKVSKKYNNCCLSQPINDSQQKQYCLSEEQINQIIVLGNQLVKEIGNNLTIKWKITNNQNSQLYITQVSIPQFFNYNSNFIKGIGAAKGRVMASAHVMFSYSQPQLEQIPKGVILVAPAITTDWLPLLHEVVGIITEKGGLTSHAAILSRELGIPAVVSAKNVTNLIQSGEKLLLDGDNGEIYRNSDNINLTDQQIQKWKIINNKSLQTYTEQQPYHHQHNNYVPMIATKLLVNISQPSVIEKVQSLPIDGIGLLRSELMILNFLEGQNPDDWILNQKQSELLKILSDQIEKFARAFAPKPILYRSLDWRPEDLFTFSDNRQSSEKSILGEHGTLSYLTNSTIFELELKALAALQKNGYTNINLMLPFVRTLEEFVFCRRKVEQAGLTQHSHFQLWIMAEVPSILFLLPEYIKAGVSGISIGTNDLTHLILGVNREYGGLASLFDERHPAVMAAISQLIRMAKAGGIPCSICGQAPALYPEIIDKLVEWGITSISVEPEAIETTYEAIARAEQRIILEAARKKLDDS